MNNINTTLLISSIRALTHEGERAKARIAKDDQELDEGASEELGLYYNDLLDLLSLMMEEYTKRKMKFPDLSDLASAERLVEIFTSEDFV